jgi:hypothetical protein
MSRHFRTSVLALSWFLWVQESRCTFHKTAPDTAYRACYGRNNTSPPRYMPTEEYATKGKCEVAGQALAASSPEPNLRTFEGTAQWTQRLIVCLPPGIDANAVTR